MCASTVAITGVAGFVGQCLVARVHGEAQAMRIVGFDVREPARRVPGFELHRIDLAATDATPHLAGVEVLYHLAGIGDPIGDEALMRRVNVDATRRLLDAADRTGVRRVVRVSPAAVYGARPSNPVPITEDAPLRPNEGYVPAVHAAEVERLLADWAGTGGRSAVVLRSAPVLGAGANHLWARLLVGPARLRPAGPRAPVQVVHVEDLASALVLAATVPDDGAYNVSASGWLDAGDAEQLTCPAILPPLPPAVLQWVLEAGWRSGFAEVPPAVVPYLCHPWVVANDRLRAAGWQPRHSNEAVLVATADHLARHTTLTRRRVAGLAVAVAVGLGASGLSLARRGGRRARRPTRA
jgi:nucleoside-diphosphate-sugar epimerase